jgi:hypothetical protein
MRYSKILVLAAASAAAVVLGVGASAAPASADPGTIRSYTFVATGTSTLTGACASTEVWGVAGGPNALPGNYQVCRYINGTTEISLSLDAESAQSADSALRAAAGGNPMPVAQFSKCTYYMPAGPNRTPTVKFLKKSFTMSIVDTASDGTKTTVAQGPVSYTGVNTVTWSPTCWTI